MLNFNGSSITYNGKLIPLNNKTIYLDGSLEPETILQYPYVYNNIKEAFLTALTDGTPDEPMQVYIAPYVYWIDDPDATDTLVNTEGYKRLYGMSIHCEWLHLYGLTNDPYQVIIAGNRGQSNGAVGNYTLFHFYGNGLKIENLTLGNYCNVDLNYPWNPSLNHKKRTSTITQAQLADLTGDKFTAINCNFISRLNLHPVSGGDRSIYYNCHFESTDDALNECAVYEKCSFDFYGGRPLFNTCRGGAVFLDCDFHSKMMNAETDPYQFFTKAGGPVTAVDCRFSSDYDTISDITFGWTKYPSPSLRCYAYNLTHNGHPLSIGAEETVNMENKQILKAYRFEYNNQTVYNTYNLLKGTDDWDPMNRKHIVHAMGTNYLDIPTIMISSVTADTIISGGQPAVVSAEIRSYTYQPAQTQTDIKWSIKACDEAYVHLTDHGDGTCTVSGCNTENAAKHVLLYASTADGLETAAALTVRPYIQPAPEFDIAPALSLKDGKLILSYSLDPENLQDQSDITWYRCTDANGSQPILTAVSRLSKPENIYLLTSGDIGYYIMARIAPKNAVSETGASTEVIYTEAITKQLISRMDYYYTDFHNFPHTKQSRISPGFWTLDYFRPSDTKAFGRWEGSDTEEPWLYGCTGNGSAGYGLFQGTQGARMMYTPIKGVYQDMALTLTADPAKTAGQGFGSADQYMDICIKFDTAALSGYGLRIIRTRAASNAVSFVLVKYTDGKTDYITEPVIASCYQTGCTISLKTLGNTLTAHVETRTAQLADQKQFKWQHQVDLQAEILPNNFGGIAVFHTGSTGNTASGGWHNTTMLHTLEFSYLSHKTEA